MSKPLTPRKLAALRALLLATGDEFREAVTMENEMKYKLALELVTRLDTHLWYGTCHFYTKQGRAILYLDEAVNAILSNDFAGTVPPKREREPLPVSVRVPRWVVEP